MTFDDGIVKIYDVKNMANPGERPRKGLALSESFYYTEQTVGITRYYEAIKAEQMIEKVIAIYRTDVNTNQIAVLENGEQFVIRMVQQDTDENGIKITKLSLERNGEIYEIFK